LHELRLILAHPLIDLTLPGRFKNGVLAASRIKGRLRFFLLPSDGSL
jgi:hypothetical protein